jgi:hypothetical protein
MEVRSNETPMATIIAEAVILARARSYFQPDRNRRFGRL